MLITDISFFFYPYQPKHIIVIVSLFSRSRDTRITTTVAVRVSRRRNIHIYYDRNIHVREFTYFIKISLKPKHETDRHFKPNTRGMWERYQSRTLINRTNRNGYCNGTFNVMMIRHLNIQRGKMYRVFNKLMIKLGLFDAFRTLEYNGVWYNTIMFRNRAVLTNRHVIYIK